MDDNTILVVCPIVWDSYNGSDIVKQKLAVKDYLLCNGGSSPSIDYTTTTITHAFDWAARNGHLEIVKFLLAEGSSL